MTPINPKLPYWHNQLVLSWYHHQPESHQQSFNRRSCTELERPRPIDRTPGTPGSGKKSFLQCVQEMWSPPFYDNRNCSKSGGGGLFKEKKVLTDIEKNLFFYQGCCAQCHRRQGSTVGEDQSCNIILRLSFLAVQNSSIGDLVTDWLTHSTFTFDIQRTTLETCDLWDIWSEWWGDMNWLKKTYLPTYRVFFFS